MDLIYWYYLGSKRDKIVNNLYKIVGVIDLYNASKRGKYTIYYMCVYSINRNKFTNDGEEIIRNWLQLSFSDDKIIESKMLRKYRHKFYSMNKFMELKKYHKEWNDESWDEIEIEELLKEFISKKN